MPINWFFLSSLALSITTLFLIIIILKFGREKIHYIWLLFNFFLFIWAISAVYISKTTNPLLSFIFWKLGCIGVTFTPVFPLHMTYLLTKNISKKIVFFSYALSIFFSLIILNTNLVTQVPFYKYYEYFLFANPGKLNLIWFLYWTIAISYVHFILIKFYLKQIDKSLLELRLLIFALAIGFISGSLNFLTAIKLPIFQFGNFGIVVYCLIVTYAIFKHQLLGLEIAYKKGILYSSLITILSSIYLLLVIVVESLFKGLVGYKSLLTSLVATFVIAILFNPLRNILQTFIDRVFLGKTSQEMARENELLKQELGRSERLKTASTLALGLAHEIRNPLTTIKTFAEYLPEKYKDDDFVNTFSKLIPAEVERINSIIKQLLDFSKPALPSFQDFNIHNLINGILEFLNSQFLKKKIKVNMTAEDTKKIIKIDPNQIKQALLNIILNAIEAMPNGGALIIETKQNNKNFLDISISDTGLGISKDGIKKIFDPFFSTKDSGAGLGLGICHQIIKNHKGLIKVESELSKGTTFIIKLPLET